MSIGQFMLLLVTIGFEVLGTTSLKLSQGFTRLIPSILVVVGYGASFYLLAVLLKQGAPIGIVYAIWSGLGTAAVALIGYLIWQEKLSIPALIGILLVIIGVALINLTSSSAHGA
jgi:small multidrug resistance pump